jgi:Flp pilus assembly protein TadB
MTRTKGVRSAARRMSLLIAVIAGLAPVGLAALAVPAHADVPANAQFQSHDRSTSWQDQGYVLNNNMAASAAAGSQTIWAFSYRNWGVESIQPGTAGVKAYPYVGRRYPHNPTYAKLRFLRSGFSESVVPAPGLHAAAAYRIWLDNRATEITIQIDNHGLPPVGHKIGQITFYFSKFYVWQISRNHYAFTLIGPQLIKGTVHLLSALRWLVNHPHGHGGHNNYLSPHATVSEVDFGWEIASTGGTSQDFDVTGYSLTSAMKVPAKLPQPATAGGGVGQGLALFAGLAGVFVALFLVTVLSLGRFDRANQGRTLSTMFERYGPRNEPAPAAPPVNQGVVATAAVGAMTRVMRPVTQDRLAKRLDLAGSTRKPAEWAVLGACLVIGIALTLSIVTSYFFVGILGGVVVGWLAMRTSLSLRIMRRRAAFSDQLPDMLQLIASTLQAGFSLPQALDAVIRQENQPAAGEFSRALAEARIGADLDQALEAVANRMDSDDLRWTVMAIRIQQGVGGNLAEVLLTIADTIRERGYLRRQVSALSAEGRLSAYILVALPIVVAIWLFASSGDYMRPLYTTPLGELLLGGAVFLLLLGAFWMHRTIKVEV